MKAPLLFLPLLISAFTTASFGEAVKDRKGAVLNDRATWENDARWIYNDLERGFATAKQTGKPLLVVLRCVPCLACAGIDAQVRLQETDLAPLLDRFVCVRVINANALDLSLFQFDYDLSFSTMFFNADGTIYGRYGSWTHQKNAQEKTTAGFKRALESALAIHKGYPANKAVLAGKQGAPTPFKSPIEIPELAGRYRRDLDWDGQVVQSCVHCHQIGEAIRTSYRDEEKQIPSEWIYPWPAPETIGITLAPDHAARVQAISEGSPAAEAGMKPGDEFVSFAGQPLISSADVSWVLHRAPDAGSLRAVVKRGHTETPIELQLPTGWRRKADISRRVGTWQMRGMATGGLVLEDLTREQRQERNLGEDQLALLVKHVGQYGKHATAKKAGFQPGDVIVSLDGISNRTTEGEMIGHLLDGHRPGERVKTVVLRGEKRVDLLLPMQ